MKRLLLDASVWLAALDRDDRHHEAARALIERSAAGTSALAALELTLYEVANVAVVRWGSAEDAARLVALVQLVCADDLERADEGLLAESAVTAERLSLTVYDAAYVAAARRRGSTLVSTDVEDLVAPGLAVAPEAALESEASGS